MNISKTNRYFPISKFVMIVMVFSFFSGFAQSNQLEISKIFERIKNEELTFRMSQNGDSLGFTVMKYAVKDEKLRLREEVSAIFNGRLMTENLISVYDLKKGQMELSSIYINYGGNELSFAGDWLDKNRIKVRINKLDTVIAASPHIERSLTLFVLPRLIHDSGRNHTYSQFNPTDLLFRDVKASPRGQTYLNTTLGRIDCSILRLEGGVANQTLFLDQKTHRIVQIEIPDVGWKYELIKISPSN